MQSITALKCRPSARPAGKPAKSLVRLEARQEGDHIVLIIADDGKGMSA
jgi:two-component system chemotaxis sensor kinase CheA